MCLPPLTSRLQPPPSFTFGECTYKTTSVISASASLPSCSRAALMPGFIVCTEYKNDKCVFIHPTCGQGRPLLLGSQSLLCVRDPPPQKRAALAETLVPLSPPFQGVEGGDWPPVSLGSWAEAKALQVIHAPPACISARVHCSDDRWRAHPQLPSQSPSYPLLLRVHPTPILVSSLTDSSLHVGSDSASFLRPLLKLPLVPPPPSNPRPISLLTNT